MAVVAQILLGVLLLVSLSMASEKGKDAPALPESEWKEPKLDTDSKNAEKDAELVKALEAEQAALYEQKKALIDKALKDIKKMNAKPIGPEDRCIGCGDVVNRGEGEQRAPGFKPEENDRSKN